MKQENLITESKETRVNRYRQIAEVLARHGLGYMQNALGLDRFLPFPKAWFKHQPAVESHTAPQHIRMVMEELGATFIKLGQLLSTRPDILSPEYQVEFAKLQDAAPSIDSEVARGRIETELGQAIENFFASFDPQPLAAASIGQAHAATLHDGTEVVVKVRRPGIVEQVEEDLEILHNLAASANRHLEIAKQYDLLGLVEEFAQTLRAELDYLTEGKNAERFAANFSDEPAVHIPRVFWETTTSRVLTLERIRGVKINDVATLTATGIDRAELAERGTKLILKMIFEDGFFHADLHPGNFFIEADGRIGVIDFGMVGVVDARTQDRLANLLLAITSKNYERLADAVVDLGVSNQRVDRLLLRRDLERFVEPYYGRPLGELAVGPLLNETFAIMRRHRMHLPPQLALLVKTIIVTEGLGVTLDPNFRLLKVIIPYTAQLMFNQFSPSKLVKKLGHAGLEMARLGIEIPQELRHIFSEIERGGFEVGVRQSSIDPIITRLERLTNRIVLGIIAAAFIVGLATLLSAYHPPGWENWAGVMFGIGFFFAVALGIYLALSILRSKGSKPKH